MKSHTNVSVNVKAPFRKHSAPMLRKHVKRYLPNNFICTLRAYLNNFLISPASCSFRHSVEFYCFFVQLFPHTIFKLKEVATFVSSSTISRKNNLMIIIFHGFELLLLFCLDFKKIEIFVQFPF